MKLQDIEINRLEENDMNEYSKNCKLLKAWYHVRLRALETIDLLYEDYPHVKSALLADLSLIETVLERGDDK